MGQMLVTGTNGFVGAKLMRELPGAVAAPSFRTITEEEIRRLIGSTEADVIVHTAAISDIGECEKDPEGSLRANVMIPLWLAQAVKEVGGKKLICFSSDQVYSGSKEEGPFTEAMVNPANLYAKHKLEMEQRVLDLLPEAVMLRAEWMYDYVSPKGNYYLNFLKAEGQISAGSKVYRGVTYVREVAENMEACASLPGGAYNFGSETTHSMYEITTAFADYLGKKIELVDSLTGRNLWMDCSKARQGGVIFSEVLEGLKRCAEDDKKRRPGWKT